MKKKKSKKIDVKIFVVIFLILILLFLGYLSYNKFINKPDKVNVTDNLPNSSNLVEGNTFGLKGIECSNETETECSKELEVSYNNKNHIVKIKRIKRVSGDTTTIKNEVYVDNILIDTLDGGVIYDSYDKIDVDFDGYLYIANNKYLIVVTPFVVEKQINYVVNYYDGSNKLGKGIDIINGEQTICLKNCSDSDNIINGLDNIEFDGKELKYWKALCENRNKQALQIGVVVENGKVTTKYLDTEKDIEIKGACN